MKNRKGTEAFSPEEMDFLQGCFDEILAMRRIARLSDEAEIVARALILGFSRGVHDRAELIRLADIADAA